VSIARAICKNTPIILADEPTGALDSGNGDIVMELLRKICKEQNKTIIMVTHNMDYTAYADRVVYMKNGKIVEIVENK
jgi:putative ABC transport system ATP-binding protein